MSEELRKAIEPLASWELYPDESPGTPLAVRGTRSRITVGDVLAARAALAEQAAPAPGPATEDVLAWLSATPLEDGQHAVYLPRGLVDAFLREHGRS